MVDKNETAIIDSTAHALKFSGFQELYFENKFPAVFEITSKPELINTPIYLHPKDLDRVPAPGKPLNRDDMIQFVTRISEEIAKALALKKNNETI